MTEGILIGLVVAIGGLLFVRSMLVRMGLCSKQGEPDCGCGSCASKRAHLWKQNAFRVLGVYVLSLKSAVLPSINVTAGGRLAYSSMGMPSTRS